jgi:uncharacterized SAM-binding protein YcdF (DUF218 family)
MAFSIAWRAAAIIGRMGSDLLFLAKKLATAILMPPMLPVVLILVGLVLIGRSRRLGLTLALLGVVLSLALSTPVVVNRLTAPLESVAVFDAAAARHAGAIVILGGGQRRKSREYDYAVPTRLTLERLQYGARIARQTGLPILVTGGAGNAATPEGVVMAESLKADFSLTPRWIEAVSRDTAENAAFSARILNAESIRRIILVTHAAHMRRAQAEFEAAGLEVITAPTAFITDPDVGDDLFSYLPGATASYSGWYAAHEWVGLLVQALRLGRL